MNQERNMGASGMDYEKSILLTTSCICERKNGIVWCKLCGFTINNARVRLLCVVHPRKIYTRDIAICPQCRRTESLREGPL